MATCTIWGVWHALEPIENYTLQTPRFMSEFGFQSFPETKTILGFAQAGDLAIDSTVMHSHQKNHGGNERILTYMLREYPEPRDFASFVYLSQVQQAEAIKVGAEHLRRNRPRTMGALFWQLNDCWPAHRGRALTISEDGRRCSIMPVAFTVICLSRHPCTTGAVDVYVVSDKLQPTTAQIRIRLLDFRGNTLLEKTQDAQVPAQSSAVYVSFNQKELLGGADPDRAFLVVELKIAGQTVSRNEVFFDTMRNLALPLKPAIVGTVTGRGGDFVLTLRSPVLARNVYLSFGDLDVRPSDNYFDLLPGEEVSVDLTTSASRDQLQQALKVISLTDAFFDERPSYREHTIPAAPSQNP